MDTATEATVTDLLGLTLLIAVGFLLAVAFYETLSTRDVLVRRMSSIAHRLSRRWWVQGLAYVATVAVGIPLLIVVWAVVLDTALFVLSPPGAIGQISLVAVSVVGAARVLACANERVAHELAKALPMALLFLLLTGGDPGLEAKFEAVQARETVALTDGMLAYLIALEISLRLLTDGSHRLLATVRHRRGIASELGVWRSGATAIGLDRGPGADGEPARASAELASADPAEQGTDEATAGRPQT